MKKIILLLGVVFSLHLSIAQNTISGVVKSSSDEVLPGASVLEKGTTNGTTTDFNGRFRLTVKYGATLVVSFAGFQTQKVAVSDGKPLTIVLREGLKLDEIIVTGLRTPPRSDTSSPLPVDIVSSEDLVATGQMTFDKALQYKIPSFNTVQTPVNDATSLLDPYEIRNMGPSRTLILVNGKRKNLSSLLYTQTSPGRGETGADLSAIPTDAIKTVQVLRDGASAQYGSDAIAGVVNIILKDDVNDGSVTLRTGITAEGDGETLAISVNNGSTIGEDKGFVNYTVDFSKVSRANRPGNVSVEGEYNDFVYQDPDSYKSYLDGSNLQGSATDLAGQTEAQAQATFENSYKGTPAYNTRLAEITTANNEGRQQVEEFLERRPDAGNINASPETAAAKFLVNAGYTLSEYSDLYFNAAYVYKKVNSFANYRTPYWRTVAQYPYLPDFFPASTALGYDGYLPTFEGTLTDYNATLGVRSKVNDWNVDVSFTTGGNSQMYTVNNSHNGNEVFSPSVWIDQNGDGNVDGNEITQGTQLYRANSKRFFDPGGTAFSHYVGNIDISRVLSDQLSVAFGSEFRAEFFEIISGELASYDAGGPDSFAGNRPEESGTYNRYNMGAYFDVAWDISKDLLVNGTARMENYSDFGDAFVWKVSSRYKFTDAYTLRASLSTGFRAPTLHQIYTQKAQYSFVPGSAIQVGGLINNVSSQANTLGIPKLDAEKSTNFTVGFGGKVNKHLNFTVDYYLIDVRDRIVLSTEIGPTEKDAVGNSIGNTDLDKILEENNLNDLSFFVNALDTRTSGLDVVVGYDKISVGEGYLGFNLSGNYTIDNERRGAVKDPTLVSEAGQSVVNATQQALFFTSRPKTKWILGAMYNIGRFDVSLNNTYFGKTTFKQQGMNENLRTEFTPKVVTDFVVNYQATDKITIALNVNNILNVLPEWSFKAENATGQAILNSPEQVKIQSDLITFNQRYAQMTYDGYHFSQLGTMFNLALNYRF